MRNGAWLDAQQFPGLDWTVPGIISEGFGLLVAPPKAGKSWLVSGIGLASAAGGIALGWLRVDQRPVLYLALEDGHRRLQDRFRKITCGQPISEGINVIVRAQSHEVIPMITEFLARQHRPALVILDTLGKIKPPKQSYEDSYQADYRIGSRLKDAVDTSKGSTLLVVHHTRKAESADFVDAVSGTQGIAGSADFVLVLSRKRHDDEAVLSVTGCDIPEADYALKSDDGLWCLDGVSLPDAAETAEKRRLSDTRSDKSMRIFSAVASSPYPMSPAEVSETLGLDNDTVGRYLRRLAQDGYIKRTKRGQYQTVSEVSERPKQPDSDTPDTSDTLWSGA
jgi:hypothetical protein